LQKKLDFGDAPKLAGDKASSNIAPPLDIKPPGKS
jgi:hypothetical protein